MMFSALLRLGAGCEVLAICLQDRFLNCLAPLGSTGSILKLAYRYFLGSVVSRFFKIKIPGSLGGVTGRKTGISASTGDAS